MVEQIVSREIDFFILIVRVKKRNYSVGLNNTNKEKDLQLHHLTTVKLEKIKRLEYVSLRFEADSI